MLDGDNSQTFRLATFVSGCQTADVPDAALAAGRDALIDTLGVGIAGSGDQVSRLCIDYARDCGCTPEASVWGQVLKTSAAEAAFVNGTMSHALDFDDAMEGLHGHPSAPAIPVALAVGEAIAASGRDVISAYVIGIEIASILGRALGYGHYLRGWHKTSTIGTFTATTIAARLYGLTAEQICHAWGLAAAQTSGLIRNFGTMAKSFQAGHAAKAGVVAADLARRGFTAQSQIFDPEGGFFQTYGEGDTVAVEDLAGALGKDWSILSIGLSFKRWPCCYTNHRPLAGIFHLLSQHDLKVEDIEDIAVAFLPGSDTALVSRNPTTGLEGMVSVEYALAAALIDGEITLGSFTDAKVQRPEIRALMQKVRRSYQHSDRKHSWREGHVELNVTVGGRTLSQIIKDIPGTPAAPMSTLELRDKFKACVMPVLGETRTWDLLGTAETSIELENIAELARLTRPA